MACISLQTSSWNKVPEFSSKLARRSLHAIDFIQPGRKSKTKKTRRNQSYGLEKKNWYLLLPILINIFLNY